MYIFIMEILIYVYCTWQWPHMWYHGSCLFMAIVLSCIWGCYMYLQLCAEFCHCTMPIGWLVFHLGSFITPFEIFTQLSSDFQQRIPGDPVCGIHYRFFQVLTHALLFHFDAIFIKFHGHLRFLGQTKQGTMAHAEIEGFSTYRAGYTQKIPSQLCTYMDVWKTVVYAAAHDIF